VLTSTCSTSNYNILVPQERQNQPDPASELSTPLNRVCTGQKSPAGNSFAYNGRPCLATSFVEKTLFMESVLTQHSSMIPSILTFEMTAHETVNI
jgi:hypothetical protein